MDTQKPVQEIIEIHGVKGMKSTPFQKTFKSQDAFEKWLEKNGENVTIHGIRNVDPTKD
jgi:hypothetical protein